MLSETDRERMRRAFHLEHKSIRQIAQSALDPLKPYRFTHSGPAPVPGPYQFRIEALLFRTSIVFPGGMYAIREHAIWSL